MRSPVALPTTLDGVLDAMEQLPGALLLAGGTDLMVQINFGQREPNAVVGLRRVAELNAWDDHDDHLDLGPMLTYRTIQRDLRELAPSLAAASRTVGSPPIQVRGTLGGNLGTASPAGDLLPVLLTLNARVGLVSRAGRRVIPLEDFLVAPKTTALHEGEVIDSVHVEKVRGPQQFLKVGPRNAMVISVASLALTVDESRQDVRCGLGSVGPTAMRARSAERFLSERVDWNRLAVNSEDIEEFARLAATEARPITDLRGTHAYRRHCIEILARRAVKRSFDGES